MGQFEYLSIAASIVLALAMGRLVSSIPYVYSPGKADLTHGLFFFWMIFGCLFQWWNLWPLNTYTDWNFIAYLILMASPILFYLASKVIVSDHPEAIESWRDHFQKYYRWFFFALFFAWLTSRIREYYFFGEIPNVPGTLFGFSAVLGAIFNNRILHLVIAAFMIATLANAAINGI